MQRTEEALQERRQTMERQYDDLAKWARDLEAWRVVLEQSDA